MTLVISTQSDTVLFSTLQIKISQIHQRSPCQDKMLNHVIFTVYTRPPKIHLKYLKSIQQVPCEEQNAESFDPHKV